MRIFVSYTRRDGFVNETLLGKLRQQLLAEGHEVFIHALMPPRAGHEQRAVMQALLRSDRVLLIQSPKLDRSPWAWLERITARFFAIPIQRVSYLDLQAGAHLPTACTKQLKSLRR